MPVHLAGLTSAGRDSVGQVTIAFGSGNCKEKMPLEAFVSGALYAAATYVAVGAICLVPFHRFVLPQLDESANGASWGFRVLVSPGLVALWPVILAKWFALRGGHGAHGSPDAPISSRNIRRMQRVLIAILAVALPVLVALAVAARPPMPPAINVPAPEESR